jgi:ribosome-binding factor A
MQDRRTSLALHLQELAAAFVSAESNRTSLITVTRAELSEKLDKVTFHVSVFPEDAEGPAIGFLMRKRGECREYIMEHASMKRVPHVEFVLDEGEKNRQRVDELLNE